MSTAPCMRITYIPSWEIMKTAFAQLASEQIPRDDGAIARALFELESMLAAWATAAANVQQKFAAAQGGKGAAEQAVPGPPNEVGRDSGPSRARATDGIAVRATRAGAPEEKRHEKRSHAERRKRDLTNKAASDEGMEDVDALLGLLDPEMASAIRVQHRLFAGRKSVQELIDSYKPATPSVKKSWW